MFVVVGVICIVLWVGEGLCGLNGVLFGGGSVM